MMMHPVAQTVIRARAAINKYLLMIFPSHGNLRAAKLKRAQYQTTPPPSNVTLPFSPESLVAIRPGFCHCNKAAGRPAVTQALRTWVDGWNRTGSRGRNGWPLWHRTA
jgi:hypothetical protein